MSPPDPHPREADRLIYAGLLGLAVATVVQLGDKADLNWCHYAAVYAFALAIPLLAVGLVTDYARRSGTPIPPWRDRLGLLGAGAAVGGLVALFFHFGVGAGVVFSLGCFAGFWLVRSL